MKAMVFAAGIGSRLKPYTDFHPKALVPVGGMPALQRTLLKLKDACVNEVVVNVHHFGCQIREFLHDNDNFGLDVRISDETELLLDTGGGLLKAASLLEDGTNEPILLHNADIITDFPISDMQVEHERTGTDVSLLVANRESSRQLYFSQDMGLKGWCNLTTGKKCPENCCLNRLLPMAFGGVHIISPTLFPVLRKYANDVVGTHAPFSIIPFYLWSMGKLSIKGHVPPMAYRWFDVGTPEKLALADKAFCV